MSSIQLVRSKVGDDVGSIDGFGVSPLNVGLDVWGALVGAVVGCEVGLVVEGLAVGLPDGLEDGCLVGLLLGCRDG